MDYVIAIELLQSSFPTHFELPNNQIIHFNCNTRFLYISLPTHLKDFSQHATMSKNSGLMDTAPGGEQTPYEAEHTDVDPPAKLSGQLGGMLPFCNTLHLLHEHSPLFKPFPHFSSVFATHQLIWGHVDSSEGTTTAKSLKKKTTDEPNTEGVSTSDKIRFGQKISEEGMGGQTSSSMGSAGTEGMYSS